MMKQYFEIKQRYKNAMLWFRLGDFYEMFGEDAIVASKILGLTLTARNKGHDSEVPMCGVPHHAAESYIARLTKAGKNVAMCDQLSDPNLPGIVKRDVVRVITPGTTLSAAILEEKANNYVVGVVGVGADTGAASPARAGSALAMAVCDITTGEFKVTYVPREGLSEELGRLQVAEVVVNEGRSEILKERVTTSHTFFGDANEFLKAHFKVLNLEGFGIEREPALKSAAALLLSYLKETQKTELAHVHEIRRYTIDECMMLDETTITNLELVTTMRDHTREASLLGLMDRTMTAMGGRLLKNWLLHPLQSGKEIENRLGAVEEFCVEGTQRVALREVLNTVADIERLVGKISLNSCAPRDLSALKDSLLKVTELKHITSECSSEFLRMLYGQLYEHSELTDFLAKSLANELPAQLKDGWVIAPGFHAELDELRDIQKNAKTLLTELGAREGERTGIGSLKVKFNTVFGYYIEISNANKHLVPADYIRKQTLVNAERYITPELKELEEKILTAEEKILSLERQLFEQIKNEVISHASTILMTAYAIAQLDVCTAFSQLAKEKNYIRPQIVEDGVLEIKGGRHPVIESLNFAQSFVPNDTLLYPQGEHIMLITGPNMAGKSTYLRQVALITLLAHIGSFVPAISAKIPLTDRIFTRVGASDNLSRGQSTFMVEMQETSYILHHATERSLIILDEIGRGTSTYDGVSIAWAILEYVHDILKANTLFATHYHELIAVAEKLPHACNWSVQVAETTAENNSEKKIVFLYKVIPGGVDRSYGIEVARLAGLPREVINRAKDVMATLEEGDGEDEGEGYASPLRSAVRSTVLSKSRVSENQRGLFEAADAHAERVHKALREIDPMNLTPMEALQKLDELKKLQSEK